METVSEKNNFDMINRREDSSYYTLQKMNQMHHEIVRRIVLGQKDHEIADAIGCTKATVKYTRESPVVKQKLEIMMGARDASVLEVRKRINSLAPLALQQLEEMMIDETASDATRTKIAQDLLDRAGYNPVAKSMDLTKFTQDKMEEIKKRARRNGLVVDEEVEDAEVLTETDHETEEDAKVITEENS